MLLQKVETESFTIAVEQKHRAFETLWALLEEDSCMFI